MHARAGGGLNFIRLATPTTDDKRLPKVLQNTSGFVYYVSITGITGAAEAEAGDVAPEVTRIKRPADLPVIVGFGINTPETAARDCRRGRWRCCRLGHRRASGAGDSPAEVLAFVKSLADGAHRGLNRAARRLRRAAGA